MKSIVEGFRKCGIYPFDPNAIDKSLLLRSCENITTDNIDLAKDVEEVSNDDDRVMDTGIPPIAPTVAITEDGILEESLFDMSDIGEISFIVGDDWVLTLEPQHQTASQVPETPANSCPPELALAAVESSLTPRKKQRFEECLGFNVDLERDMLFQRWRSLRLQIEENKASTSIVPFVASPLSVSGPLTTPQSSSTISNVQSAAAHPLVKAGLISAELVDILLVPVTPQTIKPRKSAKVLTSEEVIKELEELELSL